MSELTHDSYEKELEEVQSTVRAAHSASGRVVFWLGIVISLAHIWFNTFATLPELTTSALHFAGFGLLCALIYPLKTARSDGARRAVLAVDVVLGLLAVACVVYLLLMETAYYERGSNFIASDWVFSILCVVLGIEFTRRTTGWIIPVLIVTALTYVIFWGRYVGGVFHFPGLSAETILFRQYISTDGMFGSIARISSTYVFMFILFGAFLVRSGAGDFIINIARAVAGKMVGGPGLVAVLGSSLMGSISGSAVANTASTGVITIPLMKKSGFPARFAAGVEASASTGGQLMPPVMGAGAFVMSNYTGIPYIDIIAVAFLPALMFFLSVAFFVRIEAMKLNIVVVEDDAPKIGEVMRDGGHNLVPIVVLVALLIYGFTPTYAAGISIVSVIVASWISPHRMGIKAVAEALALGARNMAATAVLLVAVGIIVNTVETTGIGNTFSLMITGWAGGSLLITILLVGIASLVLGMGLPVTAAYIVLATLSAPAINDLITQAEVVNAIAAGQVPEAAKAIFMLVAPDKLAAIGSPMSQGDAAALVALIPPEFYRQVVEQTLSPAAITAALLSAHMVIYWLSQDSNVTPPVALTAFTAAGIAGTRPMETGVTAWKLSKGLYIVPLLFAYTPFLSGDWVQALGIFLFGCCGLFALAGALEGYLEVPVSWPLRVVYAVIGAGLLWPAGWLVNFAFLAALLAVVVISVRLHRK